MRKYTVKIIERLMLFIEVEAESTAEAEMIARDQYNDKIHVLESENFFDVEFVAQNN